MKTSSVQKEDKIDAFPVIADIKDFDRSSGVLLERMIFNHRHIMIIGCIIITLLLGYQATKLVLNAGFEKMLPHKHPYIKNYLVNKDELRGLGNTIRIVVETTRGDIFDPQYLEYLKQINDEVFLTPGVDRGWMKSLWTPRVRWNMVTEEGFAGGTVMPDTYNGSVESLQRLRLNVARANLVGSLVSENYKSSMILVSLLDTDFTTGKRLDYSTFSRNLENIRKKYETAGKGMIKIHITGFAKIVGDLIEGLKQVMAFFVFAVIIAAVVIFLYTRCLRSTVLLIACSLLAVIWQLGAISALGFELDPYAILVPFLVFAIGVSHGMQKMNGIMQDVGRGTHKLVAARYTFRRLFVPGVTALLTNVIGFAVLMVIDIPVIRDLALTASVGVLCIIFTKLILLPVLLSYIGVNPAAAHRSLREETEENKGKGFGKLWSFLSLFTTKRWAFGALSVLAVLFVIGIITSLHVKIGDLDKGAPELRPDSRYNRDNAFINSNYGLSSDQFAVIVKTPLEGCMKYPSLIEADRLARELKEVPGVQATAGVADAVRLVISGTYEGSPKWFNISRNQKVLNYGGSTAITNNPDLFNSDATVMPLIAYLTDHKAETLDHVVKVAAAFAEKHSQKDRQFLLAAGSAGIEAATNIVVTQANRTMSLYLYASMVILCFITFRSWRAVLVALIPLVLTSLLCEALMLVLGIGVKVATLPVIALGVGVGIDYALYLLSVQLAHMRAGLPLSDAYKRACGFTGRVVALIGVTLAGAVVTWAWSPIKFQADMGILLAFMFFYNMIGALIFIPALSRFILGRADEYGHVYLIGR
ncbi:MAG: MMPL family transporter [Dehalococcoidia bacterium]